MSNPYATHLPLSLRLPAAFFDDYVERCDDPGAFKVESRAGRIVSVSARPDALIAIYADALQSSNSGSAPTGTEAHVLADAKRAVSLLDSTVAWLRSDAVRLAERLSETRAAPSCACMTMRT